MADKKTKLTLDALLARKAQREAAKPGHKDVYIEALDGCLTVRKLPLLQVIDLIDGAGDDASLRENLDLQAQLIYKCCPMMQEKRLQAEYECGEPHEIVYRLLDDDLGAVSELSAAILDFYGMGDTVRDQLKNKSGATGSSD